MLFYHQVRRDPHQGLQLFPFTTTSLSLSVISSALMGNRGIDGVVTISLVLIPAPIINIMLWLKILPEKHRILASFGQEPLGEVS